MEILERLLDPGSCFYYSNSKGSSGRVWPNLVAHCCYNNRPSWGYHFRRDLLYISYNGIVGGSCFEICKYHQPNQFYKINSNVDVRNSSGCCNKFQQSSVSYLQKRSSQEFHGLAAVKKEFQPKTFALAVAIQLSQPHRCIRTSSSPINDSSSRVESLSRKHSLHTHA